MASMAVQDAPGRMTYRDVARIPAFARLWMGDFASQTADRMALVAITILVYGESASSMDVSLVMGAFFLPALLFSIPGGVAADRYPRRTVMVAAETVRVGIAVAMALAGTGVWLILLVLAFSSLTYLFYPSRQASVPCLVPEGGLMPANAAISANLILGFAVGPLAAGLIATSHGAEWALLVAAVVMAAGVTVIASIREISVCTAARDTDVGAWSSLREGLVAIKERAILWQGFALVVFVMLAVGAGAVGLVSYADVNLGMAEEGFSILLAALAVGTLVGAVVVGSAGQDRSRGWLLLASPLLAGPMLMGLALVDAVPLALAIMFLTGLAAAMVLVPFTTLLQERLGDHVMGTSFGLLSMGLTAPMLLGIGMAGPIIVSLGVMQLFMLFGTLLLAAGLAFTGLSALRSEHR